MKFVLFIEKLLKMKTKSKIDKSLPVIDLHGFRVDDVYDALDKFLRKSEASGAIKVRIITGKGTGKVREKAFEYLKAANYVPKQENEGSYLVFL